MSHKEHRSLEEIGIESFALPEVPSEETVTDTSTVIVPQDDDMAYCVVTMLTITAGACFFAQGQTAVAGSGQFFQAGVPVKMFGSKAVNGIISTPANTAEIVFQVFKRGIPRQGDSA